MMQVWGERIVQCYISIQVVPAVESGMAGCWEEEEEGGGASMWGEDSPTMTQEPCKGYF